MNDIKGEIKKNEAVSISSDTTLQIASFLIRITIITFVLLLLSFFWYLASKNSLKRVSDRTAEVDQELDKNAVLEQDLIEFQGAVANIESALQNKKQYAPIFQELANVIPKEATISNFSVDEGGQVTIEGSAPTLTAMARVLVAFAHDKEDPTKENPIFKNVTVSKFSFAAGSITFGLSAKAIPGGVK